MRCHYEVLGLPSSASEDEIRKAYKKLSLQLHPDKAQQRGEDVAVANEKFKELQGAYATLSDGRERAWYDAHRDEILRGGVDDESSDEDGMRTTLKKRDVNLWPFFSTSCFDGFGDSDSAFWAVYTRAFAMVDDAELAESPDHTRTPFGDADSPWDDVKQFYDVFVDFASSRAFANYDVWHCSGDEPRHVRRAADADNKRHRKNARALYQDMVRQLALVCRRRDPRVAARAAAVAKERDDKARRDKAAKDARRQQNLEARQRWRDDGQDVEFAYEVRSGVTLADLDDADTDSRRQRRKGRRRRDDDDDDAAPPAEDGEDDTVPPPENSDDIDDVVEAEDKEVVVVLYCEACKKTFKSDKQLENHMQSKAHKKKVASLSKGKTR